MVNIFYVKKLFFIGEKQSQFELLYFSSNINIISYQTFRAEKEKKRDKEGKFYFRITIANVYE